MEILLGLVIWVFILWGVVSLIRWFKKTPSDIPATDERFFVYERKRFLLDSNAEFGMFKLLNELYGDRFYIFPQVNYSHLVQVKVSERYNKGHRSRFDKKSADFVLCDKATVVPQLVIELDGPTHSKPRVIERDWFVDGLMKHVGLPLLHLTVGPYTPESVKEKVDRVLAASNGKKD